MLERKDRMLQCLEGDDDDAGGGGGVGWAMVMVMHASFIVGTQGGGKNYGKIH